MALGLGGGHVGAALEVSRQWRDTPHVTAALEGLSTKAAASAGTTTDATWAGPLAGYGIASEALTLLRGVSILGALEPKMRRVPFHIKVPRETGPGTGGAWIGQGLVTPVTRTAYDTVQQESYKCGVITVLSKELLKISDPDAERTIRETVVNGLASFLDQQFLLPTVTLAADLRPAAITAGATEVVTTGTSAAQINADLGALLAAVTTPGPRTWIMRQGTAARIAATIGGTAAIDVPRTLFGIPLILSANSPAQITLLDPSQILYSDDGAIELSRSENAAIQMDDAPASPPVAATTMVSLFQMNLWAIRAIRWIAYLRAQAGSVAWMTVAY
jgi:HK97 family phage major capsid protein